MTHVRAFAPRIVKRLAWDFKHRRDTTDAGSCPQDFVEFLIPRLNAQSRIVDLGCGQGNLLAALRLLGWKGEYYGVDISPKAIAIAAGMRDSSARFCVSPIEDFPVMDADAVCFLESLYYVRDIPAVISRWCLQDTYVRIVHSARHLDCISHLKNFQQEGCIYFKEGMVRDSDQ